MSPGSKPLVQPLLLCQILPITYKFMNKITMIFKMAITEHGTPSAGSLCVWGPELLHWPYPGTSLPGLMNVFRGDSVPR